MAEKSAEKRVVVRFSEDQWECLVWRMEEYGRSAITVNLPVLNNGNEPYSPRVERIALIAVGSHLLGMALARSLGKSGDLDAKVRLRCVNRFSPTGIDAVLGPIGNASKHHAQAALHGGGLLSPKASVEVFNSLRNLNSETNAILNSLLELQKRVPEYTEFGMARAEQKDAVVLGMMIAGIDPEQLLPEVEFSESDLPFLSHLNNGKVSEAAVIRHDARVFEDWLAIDGQVYDVAHFVDRKDKRRKVSVIYADKEELERVTGTDLIYYRAHYPGYVLVQYKRMRQNKTTNEWSYRPDGQLGIEIERMKTIMPSEGKSSDVSGWRLNSEPFYIKLCEDGMQRKTQAGLAKGMYFPLSLFERILASKEILGPKDGKNIGWHTAGRWLSNTSFIDLLKNGLIGSADNATDEITKIVNNALEGNRGVVVVRDEFEAPPKHGLAN